MTTDHNAAPDNRGWTADAGDWLVLGFISLFCLLTAIYPIVRAFYRFEVNYKEGWMIYNALGVAQHIPLYGTKFGWTLVDYPALSFYLMAFLSRFFHNYLLTGRLVQLGSFGACFVLIGLIIRKLTGRLAPAIFGSVFCVGLFCADAVRYIGVDDPQMLAEVFFLGGLLLYLSNRPTLGRIAVIVFLFVVGGNIKHNLVDLPLAVLIDLWLISRRKALQFLLFAAVLITCSILGTIKMAGPFFIQSMLAFRHYSLLGAFLDFLYYYSVILLPFVAALIWAVKARRDSSNRVISIFFFTSLFAGIFFSGGTGISINVYFSNFFAISIVMGMLLYSAWRVPSPFAKYKFLGRRTVPLALSAFLLLAFVLSGYSKFWRRLAELPEEQRQFDAEVSFLKAQPGPAICESLLRCFDGGKPYVYDPYHFTRLVSLNMLDSGGLVAEIRALHYGAIQLRGPLHSLERPNERFPDAVLDSIDQYYTLSAQYPDCAIYVPKINSENQSYGQARFNPLPTNHPPE
jgi:hypothetical protein